MIFKNVDKKQYPRARFELPSRRHCSEKLGAVAALYRPGIEGTMKKTTSKHAKTKNVLKNKTKGEHISKI